jgi:hypothetical protein
VAPSASQLASSSCSPSSSDRLVNARSNSSAPALTGGLFSS